MATTKPVHTLILDTGAIIRNEPSVSTLLAQSEALVTVPAIISEIRDAVTRARVETTLLPFLTLRSPSPASVKFAADFARRTGDLAVLSKPDIQIVALTYELECERNGGDWRLRNVPGQKRVNGAPPTKSPAAEAEGTPAETEQKSETAVGESQTAETAAPNTDSADLSQTAQEEQFPPLGHADATGDEKITYIIEQDDPVDAVSMAVNEITLDDATNNQTDERVDYAQNLSDHNDPASDSDGWITPSNLKKKQAFDATSSITSTPEPKTMQVAVMTTDFAMQNIILQINLNLLSPALTRVKHLKTFILRCHACFKPCKDMTKQFCPTCGQPALSRVSCSTSANGEFKIHLKRNMQWNTRGDRYSIPKAVHGSSNGRRNHGGGKGGWGTELILAEDQKEFRRAETSERKMKERSLMDDDYLPGILTGDRGRAGGRIKIGAGRNVNSKKR